MGFLDSSSITVDAILTTKGRQILSRGGNFDVTKFALSDEEIDYTMYDSTHPEGTNSFGVMIDNTSVLEATPNRTNLTSFLVNSSQIGSNIFLSQTDWTNLHWDTIFNIIPITTGTAEEEAEDYTFTIQNTSIVKFYRFYATASEPWQTVSDSAKLVVGRAIQFRSQSINLAATTTITIRGNVSGITKVATVQVRPNPASSVSPVNSTAEVTNPKF
jgi:hypothetical protein